MQKKLKILFYILPIPVIIFSLCYGQSDSASFSESINFILSGFNSQNETLKTILIDIRLPRILLTFLVGGTLAVSGASLQSVFKNPLVCPYVLGLSSGAAFGAALSLAFAFIPIQLSAFIFGIISVVLSYLMAIKNKNISVVSLVLSGVIVSGIFTALLTIVQFFSDPFRLQSIIHWTMGNLHNATWGKFNIAIIPVAIGIAIIYFMRWRLNVIALGDDEAKSSGVNVKLNKIIILFGVTLASSACVAVAGIIGLYGLIVPHIVRMLVGVDNKITIPFNFIFGGTFLLIIDDFSRTLFQFEMPIGVFTMLIGAPFFIYLMKKSNIGWE